MTSLVDLNIGGIIDSVVKGADNLFTSDDERNDFIVKFHEVIQQPQIMQALANIEATKHPSLFIAGARPAILWICALGLFGQFLFLPTMAALLSMTAIWVDNPARIYETISSLPQLDAENIIGLTLATLGMAGWRSFDKIKSTDTKKLW